MKKHVKKVVELIPVKVKMKAFTEGYYGGTIVKPGEEFVYEGNLNRAGELPLWAEVVDSKFDLDKVKADYAKKKAAEVKKVEKKEEKKGDEQSDAVGAPALPPLS